MKKSAPAEWTKSRFLSFPNKYASFITSRGHSGNIGTVQFWRGKIEISTLEESNSPY